MALLAAALIQAPARAESDDELLAQACPTKVPDFVTDVCEGGGGEVNFVMLNLPNVCKARGIGDAVAKRLETCAKPSIFAAAWKFRYGLPNNFETQYRALGEHAKRVADAGKPLAETVVLEMFNYAYLACGRDSSCHRKLFAAFPDDLQTDFARTPIYCDFKKTGDQAYGDTFVDYLVDPTSSTGFRQPVCRQFYCQKMACGDETASAAGDLFVLSSVWGDYFYRKFGEEISK